ncbi:MAG: NUDIX domain-containing protein [Bacteroidales bacterium]|nr:NUDIX domain-containing protein [Bacteroidales bacterium]MDT8431979.1 NUDIX domain-containing protein [Bacteroidales bacterium]
MYRKNKKFHVAVDCIIFGFDRQELKLLCIKRDFEPEKGRWSLMGGFLKESEDIDQAAERVLYQLTGLEHIYLEQLQAYGKRERDPAGRVISIAYYALIDSVRFDKQISRTYDASWFSLDHLPDLVFDHRVMVDKAIRRLQRRCRTQPIGFELLPEKFTLPQLQLLYEEIFGRAFDKRNFRKKILAMGILNKLEEKDKEGSRKGAYLYQFDKDKYDAMMNNGFNFEI